MVTGNSLEQLPVKQRHGESLSEPQADGSDQPSTFVSSGLPQLDRGPKELDPTGACSKEPLSQAATYTKPVSKRKRVFLLLKMLPHLFSARSDLAENLLH